MSTKKKVLLFFGGYALLLIAMYVIFGSDGKNDSFQPQNEFRLDNWVELSIAGIEPPAWLQGHAFAGPHQTEPQPFLFGERGRMDERMDLVRSVTDGRYVYLRNYYPHVSQGQRVAYQFETPTTRVWRELYDAGGTTAARAGGFGGGAERSLHATQSTARR